MDRISDVPLLTSSDYESIMEDLKSDTFVTYGSPLRLEQNLPYEETMQQHTDHPPAPPPLQEFGPAIESQRNSEQSITPPEMSPSLSPTGTMPSRDVYPGLLEFELLLDSTTASKRSWLYSHTLKKVFIDMEKSLLVQFRLNEYLNGLFVRALPVYEQDDYISIPVQRCNLHGYPEDVYHQAHPRDNPRQCFCHKFNLVRHVVRSAHPQAQYDYDPESDRHSILVPVECPQPGSDTVVVEYHFTCKTSCPLGMNRKPILVIFTLENNQRDVLGRLILPVKICSCPKRDKEKEEADATAGGDFKSPGLRKRRMSSSEKQNSKKVKIEDNLPQINEAVRDEHKVDSGITNKIEEIKKITEQMNSKFDEMKVKQNEMQSKQNEMQAKQNEMQNIIKSIMEMQANLKKHMEVQTSLMSAMYQVQRPM